ncbi:MAG: hypothetical protein GY766_18475 [Herbaspirillum sp.]|uniref:hypothetical protein n=1 Tax=Herbaspirillum sp. TaxID=1890675 RepID=UPI0025839E7E|nr:hypothetical protein [Herbaspirillum sp.]MCP3656850.1 hypothetical protein [Herbaspirillum sp.]
MGVDAKAILTSNPSPIQVMRFLNELDHVTKVSITPTYSTAGNFVYVNATWHKEDRNIACFYDGECKCDYETVFPHNACYVSIGKWGMSDAVIMALVKEFGGFYMLNDCTDEWKEYVA